MSNIKWSTTKENHKIIAKIALRAYKDYGYDYKDIQMDLTCVHLNDCELRLEEFLNADKFNFSHDISGIRNNLNRNTGKLDNCFLPRYSA